MPNETTFPETITIQRISDAVERVGGVHACATILDVTTQAIYAWKKGHRPGRDSLRRLAAAAGCSVEWLNGEIEDDTRLRDVGPAYGASATSIPVPPEIYNQFHNFAARYGLAPEKAFQLLFDSFFNRMKTP